MDTGQRISEIQKRLNSPGGYDFYQSLHRAVRLHAEGKTHDAAAQLAAPANDVERKHNQDAFQQFEQKFGSLRSLEPIEEKRSVNFKNAGIKISLDPLFEFQKGGSRNAYSLWATKSPALTQRYGAVACHLMRKGYANDPLGNASFHYFDLVASRAYSEKQVNNNTNLILAADINSIGTLIKEL